MLRFVAARRMPVLRRAVIFLCAALGAGCALAQSKIDPSRGAAKAAACGACHGTPERAALPGTPYLAGQQREFLELQMFLFREGLREAPQMAGVLKGVTDAELVDMAIYFARQTAPRSNSSPDPKLRARGAAIAKAMGCGSCHLPDYRGQRQVPRLINQREDYLLASMKDYRDNKRTGTDTSMNAVLYQVPDSDIQALAHFLAHQ